MPAASSGQPPALPTAAPVLDDARRLRADRARQVADVLRRQVLHGAFPNGLLPGEATLAKEFGASRNAVRDALAILGSEGLITRVQGTGTVVAGRKYQHGLEQLRGLAETLREHGEVINEVRAAGTITAPPAVADRLRPPGGAPLTAVVYIERLRRLNGLPPGGAPLTAVVYIERLRRLNGLPLSLDLTYLASDVGEPLLAEDLEHNDIFALLEARTGHGLGTASVTVEAVSADPHTAAVLETPPGTALLMVERLTRLASGRPVDLEYIRLRGDRLALRGELSRTDP
jgi:GntR family transcriptional regulator